ncbi:MAG: tetratricopeptide repeat protein [Isosphaeraceae bacterium]
MFRPIVFLVVVLFSPAVSAFAADIEEVEKLFRTGRYDEVARLAGAEIETGTWSERYSELKIEAELARGKYAEAKETLEEALRRFRISVSLRLLGREVYRYNGGNADAASQLDAIEQLILRAPERFTSPENRLCVGRFFLLRGADARTVLEQFYDVVTKERPTFVAAFLATARLALDKEDDELAAETLRKAPQEAAQDPGFHYLLARSLSDGDRAGAEKAVAEALKINPRHVDSLLLQADHLIDGERYAEAAQILGQVFDVNPHEPRAWAYQAVLAHLRNDPAMEAKARQSALSRWDSNPEVDSVIGRKLSQKYRFAEGAAYQKKALEFDPDYAAAKVQLCQDLLRLGDEAEGWKLADQIFAKDAYNVVAYNLVTLRDRLSRFRALSADGFIVRMESGEAELYGERVLELLRRSKKAMCEKYGVTLSEPVIVEIFPQHKEFAVRTFGLPGADGLLGVCFGRVITANSPASHGDHPSNWEAVLWHEFCHVVTLVKTRNKMPRWLSEGISVYEEGCQDPAWGTKLNPRFRAMILGSDLTPLSRLSSAFLGAKSPLHLQFAYYESSLAVDFLVRSFGLPALKGVLDDLGAGQTINETLPRRAKTTLEELDRSFAKFARERASSVASELTWEEPDLPDGADSSALAAWLDKHPRSFWGWRRLGMRLVTEEKWQRAQEVLERLKALYPDYVGPENAYMLLATVHRRLSSQSAEHKVLEELAARDGDASAAYLRLIELDLAAKDWQGLAKNAQRLLAVNPLVPSPHRALARAAEELGERELAVAAYRATALLDDTDPAAVHYHLARLLKQSGKRDEACREVLKSLEEAPRFLDAHRLLLELTDRRQPAAASERSH